MKVTPLFDRVLVLPSPSETITASGLIIPETAQEKPNKGVVVAVGSGANGQKPTVKVDDNIIYNKHAGTELIFDGVSYLMMKESDILAII